MLHNHWKRDCGGEGSQSPLESPPERPAVGAAQALSGELDAVGNSLVAWAAPAISEIKSGSKLGLNCAYRYTPVMEPVTYKGQRADGWIWDIAARKSADSLRLTRETRYKFAVSQQNRRHQSRAAGLGRLLRLQRRLRPPPHNWRASTAGSDDDCAACCGRNGKRDDDGSRNSDARGSARK